VPFEGIDGSGVLYAARPERIEFYLSGWEEVDVLVAQAPKPLRDVDAIVGLAALPYEGIMALNE